MHIGVKIYVGKNLLQRGLVIVIAGIIGNIIARRTDTRVSHDRRTSTWFNGSAYTYVLTTTLHVGCTKLVAHFMTQNIGCMLKS